MVPVLNGTLFSMFIDKSYNKVIIYQFKDNVVYTSLFMQQLNCIERKSDKGKIIDKYYLCNKYIDCYSVGKM